MNEATQFDQTLGQTGFPLGLQSKQFLAVLEFQTLSTREQPSDIPVATAKETAR